MPGAAVNVSTLYRLNIERRGGRVGVSTSHFAIHIGEAVRRHACPGEPATESSQVRANRLGSRPRRILRSAREEMQEEERSQNTSQHRHLLEPAQTEVPQHIGDKAHRNARTA